MRDTLRRRGEVVAVGRAVTVLVGWRGGGAPVPPPASVGNATNLSVPADIANLRLIDQHSAPTALSLRQIGPVSEM